MRLAIATLAFAGCQTGSPSPVEVKSAAPSIELSEPRAVETEKGCRATETIAADLEIEVGGDTLQLKAYDGVCYVLLKRDEGWKPLDVGEGPCHWLRWRDPWGQEHTDYKILGAAGDVFAIRKRGRTQLVLIGGAPTSDKCDEEGGCGSWCDTGRCGAWSRLIYIDEHGLSMGSGLGGDTPMCANSTPEGPYFPIITHERELSASTSEGPFFDRPR